MRKSQQCWQTFRISNRAVSRIHTDQVNVVSFVKKSIDQSRRAVCFCGRSVSYFFYAPNFYSRIVLGMQKRIFQKTAFWTLIDHNCWKTLPLEKNSSKHRRCFESWLKNVCSVVSHFIPCWCSKFSFRARTVWYIKCTVDNGCPKPPFLMSFLRTKILPDWIRSLHWTFFCFETRSWTGKPLYKNVFAVREPETIFWWV